MDHLAELSGGFGQSSSDSLELIVTPELRFGEQRIADARISLMIQLRRACLRISLANARIMPGSRIGEELESVELEETETDSQSLEHEGGWSGKIGTDSASASLSGKGKSSENEGHGRKISRTLNNQRVRSLAPGNRWELYPVNEPALRGRYVGDDTLCVLELDELEGSVDLTVSAYKQDFEIQVLEHGLLSPTRRKLLKIVAAKSIGQCSDEGELVLSRCKSKWSAND